MTVMTLMFINLHCRKNMTAEASPGGDIIRTMLVKVASTKIMVKK